jgi:surface protein
MSNIFGKIKKNNKSLEIKESKRNVKIINKINKRNQTLRDGILIKLIIISNIIEALLNKGMHYFYLNLNKITLKIKGIGYNDIFCSRDNDYSPDNYPNEVYINDIKQDIVKFNYFFNRIENVVKLIWNNNILKSCFMFYGCTNITDIDLSEFNTSLITQMQYMFRGCESLTSMNLLNFDTSQVTEIYDMFYDCSSLTSLNISHFNTSQFTNMDSIFNGCSSLVSLNLPNFEIPKVSGLHFTFLGCENLEYINLEHIDVSHIDTFENIFENVPDNVVICINMEQTKIISQLSDKRCYTIDCSQDWKSKQKKIIEETGTCNENCGNDIIYKYEYNGKCYEYCPNGYITDENNIRKCKCELEKCLLCPSIALQNNLCTKCNEGYYPMENDNLNLGEYINCYKNLRRYYIDKNDYIYKKCYYTCNSCEINGNNATHNCLECNDNFPYIFIINNYSNCYESFDQIKDMIQNIIINENEDLLDEEDEIQIYDKIIKNIELIFTSKDYNLSNLENGEEDIIKYKKIKITLTTLENEKSNKYNNVTSIDLSECETSLRTVYNITNNTIYMKKIDIEQEKIKIPKIEYDVYSKSSNLSLEKLNLSLCQNTNIYLTIPITISENIDKLDSRSAYYNDICYSASSNSGTDITLNDRKNIYINENKMICQDDCDIFDYSSNMGKVTCSCKATQSSSSFVDMKIDKSKLLKNFIDIKNIANLNILKCYKQLFDGKNILFNVGFFIITLILIFHIISIFIFFIKQFKIIKNYIKEMISEAKNIDLRESNQKIVEKNQIIKSTDINVKIKRRKFKDKIENKNIITINNNNNIPITINVNNYNRNTDISSKLKNKAKKRKIRKNREKNNKKDNLSNSLMIYPKSNEQIKIKKTDNTTQYNYDELNKLSFELAIQYDKRKYCEYYKSLIKTKHILVFSFFNNNDYNSKIIKIDLFFIGFAIYYDVNTLFYSDDTMHSIYVSEGSYGIEYQLPKIIYSSFISLALNYFLKLLAISNDTILKLKYIKSSQCIKRKKHTLNVLKIKFISFFILSFILLLFSWYYISMFGAIYKNTQYHLIKDTLISFVISLISTLIYYFIPGLFRIPSLSNPSKNKKYLYNFSKILQMI